MAAHNHPFSYDPEKHTIVARALKTNTGNTSAYIRACIVFYETYKNKQLPGEEIARRLETIEEMLKNGITLGGASMPDGDDRAFDDLLKQFG